MKTVSTIRTRITTKITKTIVRSTRPPTTEIINSFDDEFERFVNVFSFPWKLIIKHFLFFIYISIPYQIYINVLQLNWSEHVWCQLMFNSRKRRVQRKDCMSTLIVHIKFGVRTSNSKMQILLGRSRKSISYLSSQLIKMTKNSRTISWVKNEKGKDSNLISLLKYRFD